MTSQLVFATERLSTTNDTNKTNYTNRYEFFIRAIRPIRAIRGNVFSGIAVKNPAKTKTADCKPHIANRPRAEREERIAESG